MPGAISKHCSLLLSSLLGGGLGGGGLGRGGLLASLGDDLNRFLDSKASLLAVDHNLEAFEVVKVGASGSLCELSGDGGLGPLGGEVHFLHGLKKGAGTGAMLDGDHHLGE